MLAGWIDRIAAIRVMDAPVGKGFIYTVAMGLADAAIGAIEKVSKGAVPAWAAGAGTAIAVRKIGAVKGFLGDTGSEAIGIAGVRAAIDQTVRISDMPLSTWIGTKISGAVPGSTESPGLGAVESAAGLSDGNLAAAQEYLTSVERKIRGIAQG